MTRVEARQLLGVGPAATLTELKAAYRRAARACHPDVGGDPSRFADVAAAFELLTAKPAITVVPRRSRWQAIRSHFRRTTPSRRLL
jgi:curved DNA-binding protein CbpA